MAEPPENTENLPEAAPHSTADYEQFGQPDPEPESEKPERHWGKAFLIIFGCLILVGAGAAAYWYTSIRKPAPKAQPARSSTNTTAPAAAVSSSTKSYTSPNLYLTFSYPANWKIVDSGNGALTATSPSTQLKTPAGQSVSGQIVMTIKTTASSLPGFSAGNAVAVVDSQKITYTKPTQTQRADTYVTLIAYASTKSSGALDAIYITGNNGYTKDQAVPQADLVQVSPVVSLTFVDSTGKALTVAASEWDNSSFSTPILDMLKSLAIT